MNFDGSFPNAPFTAVIYAADADKVGNILQYEGKRVVVTGKIALYRGKPEIVVHSAMSLRIQP